MNIIPNWKERNLRCHFCDETRSVKYEIEVFDPVNDSKPRNVCICNKCALRYIVNAKDVEMIRRNENTEYQGAANNA